MEICLGEISNHDVFAIGVLLYFINSFTKWYHRTTPQPIMQCRKIPCPCNLVYTIKVDICVCLRHVGIYRSACRDHQHTQFAPQEFSVAVG